MKNLNVLIAIFIVVLGTFFLLWNNLTGPYLDLTLNLPESDSKIIEFLKEETTKQVLTPPPLRIPEENPESFLTRSGIIEWTNKEREEQGLAPLEENEKLNYSALIKAQDMFAKQYFSHDSPSGVSVGDLAQSVGYEFIIIGENLALGDFHNDEEILQGWMNSPGHRENILNDRYQEIGVAVVKDIFEGRTTWIAVQHFATPIYVCPQPNNLLKAEIELNQEKIEGLYESIISLRDEIKDIKPRGGRTYNQKVKEYNDLVFQYNALIEETKELINNYNNQIKLFNECIAGN
jgi:uncharacterized protein YkwD